MKNEMKILNTYINNVCKGIRDRKVKNELKDELLSHLLEIYERNIALGLSDEDAQKDVYEQFEIQNWRIAVEKGRVQVERLHGLQQVRWRRAVG